MDIGQKIKSLRKTKKLTQEQLAEYLQISSQAVSKWETGVSSPDIDMLPRLAVFFGVSIDELMDFDKLKIDDEVQKIVEQSVPLRADPEEAEAFYREALKKYPNNEVLLNCLLMVIPNDRIEEKISIGQQLMDCTDDDEIRLDVIRLLALTYKNTGENAMAEHFLSMLPELYFLKTEIAAYIKEGHEKLVEIRKTEDVCLSTLISMLAMRINAENSPAIKESYKEFAHMLLDLYSDFDDQKEHAAKLRAGLEDGSVLDFYKQKNCRQSELVN